MAATLCTAFLVASCVRPRQTTTAEPPPQSTLPRVATDVGSSQFGIGGTVANLRITTLAGATLSLDDLLRDRRALVLAMASAECPLAVEYGPRMAAIEREFEGRVAFLHVNPVDGESIDAVRAMIRESGLRGAYARDADAAVRRELQPKTTTEVFVLTPARQIVYRGAIDDQYRLGGKAAKVQREYLRDALRAVIDGRSPSPAATSAPGCLVDLPRARREGLPANQLPAIPFYPRVADVLERNCVQCHQPGGSAPFSLASPASLEGRAAMIAAVVREGIMPPNHGLSWSGPEPMVRDRAMPREDRVLLLAWLESDRSTPQAMPADQTPSISHARATGRETWSIGTPDFMLITPGPTLQPQDVPKAQRYFVPVNLEMDAWVDAIECRPVMRDSVAVAQVWLVRPGESLPTMDEFPASEELFATFSRSDRVVEYAPGSARLLPAHCVLVVDLQGRAMATAEPSQLRIALRFAKAEPRYEVRTRILHPDTVRIAPGDPRAELDASAELPDGVRIMALRPLMGPRTHSLRVSAGLRGETPVELLDLGRYDWRWLIRYPLRTPLDVAGRTRIQAMWMVNNSAANPVNPDPSAEVSVGMGDAKEPIGVAIEYEQPVVNGR